MKEFNLSDKLTIINDEKVSVVFKKDVKEFIKRLKEFVNRFDKNQMTNLIKIIDKLAGEELI